MNSARSSYAKYAVLTSLALALTLSSCSAPISEDTKPSKIAASETIAPTASASAEPVTPATSAPTAVATSVPTAAETAASSPTAIPTTEMVSPALKTYTFPDGHISFDYPANWKLEATQGQHLNETDKANAVAIKVYDESGSEVAVISSGGYGGGVSGPVVGHVYDSEPMAGLPTLLKGGTAKYAFLNYHLPNEDKYYYNMGVFDDRFVTTDGDSYSPNQFVLLENGAASASVTFGSPAFKSPESAKAWMETQQYSQLKAMMTSLSYK